MKHLKDTLSKEIEIALKYYIVICQNTTERGLILQTLGAKENTCKTKLL